MKAAFNRDMTEKHLQSIPAGEVTPKFGLLLPTSDL